MKKLIITAGCGVIASLALTAGALAASHVDIVKGKTAQGREIRLKVRQDRVQIQGFSIQLRCSDDYTLIDLESGFQPSTVNVKGRIHESQVGSTDEVLIRGQLTTDALRGRIRVRDRLGKRRCSSPWVPFTAHR